ncbi:hypothetical protein N7539_004355 [Penicillium diatomitis]|uniref:F-box domain-containing protein n=1 Tax=Penicillium diatomitis TaxID=2819901 RepID=A0A9W9XDN7_9EURO|nr:uncharacterized protein N7539_004355 [Penicillium diatomitis]KAJ5489465.1 hypothetical protein N7539_004355 [Penicillium diatomitis]
MTATSFDRAGRPVSDKAMSSGEEDFVSSQTTPTAGPDNFSQSGLSPTMNHLQLDNSGSQASASYQTAPRLCGSRTDAPQAQKAGGNGKGTKLELLDLPLDILREIVKNVRYTSLHACSVKLHYSRSTQGPADTANRDYHSKQVTQTNDLTCLALTCSSLHNLTIPHMYSRFDIVWPEATDNISTEDYSGVDALSYGLSTLVMGEDIFHQSPYAHLSSNFGCCARCGYDGRENASSSSGKETRAVAAEPRSRRGNYYAQFTRTFSIGNGPLSWVQEYSVDRDMGKMLGTLVALAVARMVNLEAFIWDMPTGVVREIWLALASLANRPGHECRLERVWVRWHDNSENHVSPSHALLSSLLGPRKNVRIEHPSLSVLPPLKSVTVLDIDETAYLDELAVLIERSRARLTELRIGISAEVKLQDDFLPLKDNAAPRAGWPKPSGVLCVLCPIAQAKTAHVHGMSTAGTKDDGAVGPESSGSKTAPQGTEVRTEAGSSGKTTEQTGQALPNDSERESHIRPSTSTGGLPHPAARPPLELQVLELERVSMHLPTLLPALDWTHLSSLTLLGCVNDGHLWKALRRKYSPPMSSVNKQASERRPSLGRSDYPLNLKHLHTNSVSSYLMLFIKEALAPNTLESVYLHETVLDDSTVPLDAIHKYVLRRHRLSLRKVLIKPVDRPEPVEDLGHDVLPKWAFNYDIITFVTSGRMPQLRELGMAIDHRYWHYFLQRMPSMTQLYALYLAKTEQPLASDLKELALQVLDIVSIRPDLKLTYIGLRSRCYQIMESEVGDESEVGKSGYDTDRQPELENWTSDAEEEMSTTGSDHHNPPAARNPYDSDALSSDFSDGDDSDLEANTESRTRFWLYEMPYCDDKVSIFKARHAAL